MGERRQSLLEPRNVATEFRLTVFQIKLHKDHEVYLPQLKFEKVRKDEPNKMVRDVLTIALTRSYMANHSVDGKIANAYAASRKIKPPLPVDFVDAICRKYDNFLLINFYNEQFSELWIADIQECLFVIYIRSLKHQRRHSSTVLYPDSGYYQFY